jgi:hypothetical protein
MLLLIDIFSINKGRGYENPSLEIIVIERCSIEGCPLEEAYEHCFLNQSVIYVIVLISFMCYCGDYAGYMTVILPFLAFYFCSAYLLYLVSCMDKAYYMVLKCDSISRLQVWAMVKGGTWKRQVGPHIKGFTSEGYHNDQGEEVNPMG